MILTTDAKNVMLQGLADRLNANTSSVLSIYVGAILAAEFTLKSPVQSGITGAVLTFKKPVDVLAIASGLPTAAKILDFNGVVMAELDVATELTLDKDKIYAGGYVGLTTLTIGI